MNILLITPPLTQVNAPYSATPYLQGFLLSRGYQVHQADLGIELVNKLFTKSTITRIFEEAALTLSEKTPSGALQIIAQKQQYIQTIEPVMRFLQNQDPTLALRICNTDFLPEGPRFQSAKDLDWAFGNLGLTDKARYLATLYIEDLTDFIHDTISPYFELGRYAEHLSAYAPEFDPLEKALLAPENLVDALMIDLLKEKISQFTPDVIGFSIPFPGNLYGALKCSAFIKQQFGHTTVVWGGGYVNTELRQLEDAKVFDYTDYILYDHGELPFLRLLEVLQNKKSSGELIRTKCKGEHNEVVSMGWNDTANIPFSETGTPDYGDLPLSHYISLIETANPMHKLWSDGRWNKLTLANGCYWAKCAFCDTSLPYISCYEPGSAALLADRMEQVMKQTGSSGFHFVDEAAPPKVLRELSEEIIRRKLTLSWWANVRFEKAFQADLCSLMAQAGCIAVSGGLEVASNRLLKLMNKGVTVEQAAQAAHHLTSHGIMVHAYLMYGFPTQTLQETIDALELVRQMFNEGLITSAFWHRYAMTVHSPSGINPSSVGAKHIKSDPGTFANNEIPFTDDQQLNLDAIGQGLRKATYNYMHQNCLDWAVTKWFPIKVPRTTVPIDFIRKSLS